jgi:hypothetical protein
MVREQKKIEHRELFFVKSCQGIISHSACLMNVSMAALFMNDF